ncbi:MAG TPA: CHRD domain-containing protein [Acidobacteriota bacterium]|nr:CHRD domain-containing protein [Acidobacteriota bacterium]
MNRCLTIIVAGIALWLGAFAAPVQAQKLHTDLKGFAEVPANSTVAHGEFQAEIINDTTIAYELTYSGLEDTVRQAHIHFGQRSVAAGISLWLCQTATNLDPTGLAPTCPQTAQGATTVKGNLTRFNLVGPSAQGIAGGATGGTAAEFAEIIAAIRAGMTYANVHSTKFPSGEIRGQIKVRGRHDEQHENSGN